MTRCARSLLHLTFLVTVGTAPPSVAQSGAQDQLARDVLQELIQIRSTAAAVENTVVAAEAMQKRLVDAGFSRDDAQLVVGPGPKIGNLIARYRGDGSQRPILLMCHLDAHRSVKKTATSTVAVRRTTNRAAPSWSPT